MKQRAHPTVNTNITNVLSKIRGGGGGWEEWGSRAAEWEAEWGQKNWTNIRGSFQKKTAPPQRNTTQDWHIPHQPRK